MFWHSREEKFPTEDERKVGDEPRLFFFVLGHRCRADAEAAADLGPPGRAPEEMSNPSRMKSSLIGMVIWHIYIY